MAETLAGDEADPSPSPAPRILWPTMVGTALSVIGFGVAGYLTYEHYTSSTSLTCPASGGIVNCLKVTTSQYSHIAGIPVALLGLIFFAVMLAVQSPWAWRSYRRPLRVGRVLWSVVGVGTAVWLIYAELVKLDAICLWCTAVHVISVLLFATTAFATAATVEDLQPAPLDG